METQSWSKEHHPAAGERASCAKPSAGSGVRNVCRAITATLAAGATDSYEPVRVLLRDGDGEGSPVLWSGALTARPGYSSAIAIGGLSIVGSPNAQMTLGFECPGAPGVVQTVAMSGDTVAA